MIDYEILATLVCIAVIIEMNFIFADFIDVLTPATQSQTELDFMLSLWVTRRHLPIHQENIPT